MNNVIKLFALGMLALGLAACETTNQTMGTATGSVIGGVIGSQFGGGSGRVAATIGGALIGGLIGGSIGTHMDKEDQRQAAMALESTPTGQSATWVNPDSDAQYTVTPTKTFETASGQPCREFTTTANIGGKSREVYGKACRDASGAWKVIS